MTNKEVLFFIRDKGFATIPEMARHFDATSDERLSQLTATVEALVAVGQVKREARGTFRAKITTETVRLTLAAKGPLTEQEITTLFLPQETFGDKGMVGSMVHSALSALIVPTRIEEQDDKGRPVIRSRPPQAIQTPRHRQAPTYAVAVESKPVTTPQVV